jgi:hypothetical protein
MGRRLTPRLALSPFPGRMIAVAKSFSFDRFPRDSPALLDPSVGFVWPGVLMNRSAAAESQQAGGVCLRPAQLRSVATMK